MATDGLQKWLSSETWRRLDEIAGRQHALEGRLDRLGDQIAALRDAIESAIAAGTDSLRDRIDASSAARGRETEGVRAHMSGLADRTVHALDGLRGKLDADSEESRLHAEASMAANERAARESLERIGELTAASAEQAAHIVETVNSARHANLNALAAIADRFVEEIGEVDRGTSGYLAPGAALGRLEDGTPILVDPDDFDLSTSILAGYPHQPRIVDLLLSFVRPDTVFVDVGAQLGVFALQVARRLKGGRVVAFEPQRRFARLLGISVRLNGLGPTDGGGRIDCFDVSASDENGRASLDAPTHSAAGARFSDRGPQTIETARLDDFLPADFRCDLARIDADGDEVRALEGMSRILARSPEAKVLVRNAPLDAARCAKLGSFFVERGFDLFSVEDRSNLRPVARADLAGAGDFLFAAPRGALSGADLRRHRFSIFPENLATALGSVEAGRLRCEGAAGSTLFFGPYWFLRRGEYRAVVTGRIEGSVAIVVQSRAGREEARFTLDGETHEGRFALRRDAVQFECRAEALSPGTRVDIASIEISAV